MMYDSTQLDLDLRALRHNKEVTMQQYHKICGAIEMVEAMHKNALEAEQKAVEEAKAAETNDAATMDSAQEAA